MKKDLFIYAALCALVAAGCSKQDEAETLQPGQGEALNITISATRHEAPSTRTEYEEAADRLIVKWNSDTKDKLGVFTTDNGTTNNAPFMVDGNLSADGKTAHFEGRLTVSTPSQKTKVYGYYPFSSTAGSTPQSIPIDLSNQKQTGISDKASLAHLAAKDYMAATPVTKKLGSGDQNLSLEFNPLLTIMSFEIAKAMNVKSIKLEAVGESNKTPFHTQGGVDITFSPFPIFHNNGTDQSSIELNAINGTISTTGMFNMMIFPIAADAMPTEFKATVTTTDGTIYVQTKPAPTTGFERGKRYIMALDGLTKDDTPDVWDGTLPTADNAYAYSGGAGTTSSPYEISTAKDLAQLAANVNAAYDTSNSFILMKDINLNNKEWKPIGIYDKSSNYFKGTFDGGSKAITGMKITKLYAYVGLFGYVYGGTIKNINVAGEITINASSTKDIYTGGISGYCYDATLSGNLTSHVNITITNTDSGFLRIGGVTGFSNTNTNKAVANVTLVNDGILSAEGPAEVNVGGVIGYVMTDIQQSTTLINSGAVSGTSSGKTCRVGGLIGYSDNAVTCNGTNTGSVMGQISGGTSSVYSGGFIGYANIIVTIESTLNTGTVEAITNSLFITNSYAGIRVGGVNINIADHLVTLNQDADGNPSGTGVVTATAKNGKSYVNGLETTSTP